MGIYLNNKGENEGNQYIDHMLNYLKKTVIIFILVFLFALILTIIGIYKPLLKEIEKNSLDYFKLLAETRMDTFDENISKNIQATKVLSSRSEIRDKGIDYVEGRIDFRELQSYTSGKYLDGVRVIEDISYAIRIVDGKEVAGIYNNLEIKYNNKINLDAIKQTRMLNCNIEKRDGITYLDVISPIIAGSRIVGYDLVGFNLENTLKGLNTEDTSFDIYYNLEENSEKSKARFEEISESEGSIYFIKEYMDNIGLVVKQPIDITYKNINAIKNKSFTYIFIGYGIILIIIFALVGRLTNDSIKDLSIDRDTYKRYADLDSLTGAYSRLFLDVFSQEYPYSKGILILIDMDGFKNVNDNHGHIVGDEVLKYFVYRVKKVIRSDDLVIRYGGDEFLIILRDALEDKVAIDLINRIKLDLKKQNHFNFDIGFSYGITRIDSMMDINKHIHDADCKMYLNKQSKKIHKDSSAY